MNMKVFGFLIALVVIALGVASYSLFEDSSAPSPAPEVKTPTPERQDPSPVTPPTLPPDPTPTEEATRDEVKIDPKDASFSPSGKLFVRGKILSRDTRQPIPAAEVIVHDDEGDAIEHGKSGDDGGYQVVVDGLVPPKVLVSAEADGFSAAFAAADVGPGETRTLTIDLELGAEFTIEGRVTNSLNGQPVEEASVEVRCLKGAFGDAFESEDTDQNGYYRIGPVTSLPREGIDVFVDPDGDFAPMLKTGLTIEPGQSKLVVDFVLYPNLKLRGRIASERDGRPIAEAMISALSVDPEYSDLGEDELTEEDGTFEFELSATPYEGLYALFTADGHGARVMKDFPQPANDGSIDLGTILLPQPITVNGVVVEKRTGLPVKGGDVAIYAASAPGGSEFDYTDNEIIDPQTGRFSITLQNTPFDDAEIEIDAVGCVRRKQPLLLQANVAEQEIRVEVEPNYVLTGRVTRQVDGSPVLGAIVRVYAGRDRHFGRAIADGTYRVEIPPQTDFSKSEVVVQWADKRFKIGPMPVPGAGSMEIRKDLVVDLPAGMNPRNR